MPFKPVRASAVLFWASYRPKPRERVEVEAAWLKRLCVEVAVARGVDSNGDHAPLPDEEGGA